MSGTAGTPGNDTFTGGVGDDTLSGAGGNDILDSGAAGGADWLDGGAGNDTLIARHGLVTLIGGAGADSFRLRQMAEAGAGFGGFGSLALVADFRPSEGDRIGFDLGGLLPAFGLRPLVLGGLVTARAGVSASYEVLPDSRFAAEGASAVYWAEDTTSHLAQGGGPPLAAAGWLLVDRDGNGMLAPGDFAIRVVLAQPGTAFGADWFAPGELARTGGAGADAMTARAGGEVLLGGGGDDLLAGGPGRNALFGGEGDDALALGAGQDVLTGGPGADTFRVPSLAAVSSLGSAADSIEDFGLGDVVDISALGATFVDGPAFLVTGAAQARYAAGLLLFDGNGDGVAERALHVPLEGVGPALVLGETEPGSGLLAAFGAVAVAGGPGPTKAAGGPLGDTLDGGEGDDELYGRGGADLLLGRAGDDVLDGGAGADSLAGGAGNDRYVVDEAGDVAAEEAGGGTDTVFSSFAGGAGFALGPNIELAYLIGAGRALSGGAGEEQLVANPGLASTLHGQGGNDVLWGGAQADFLFGGDGNDVLRSGGGADHMEGGAGDDDFVVESAAAAVVEGAGGGYDTAWVTVSGWTAAPHLEVARLLVANALLRGDGGNDVLAAAVALSTLDGGHGDDELWGSAGADLLIGGEGRDILRGGGGADSLVGGGGHDDYVLLDATATVVEEAGGGYDTVWITADRWQASANLEVVRLSGAATRVGGSDGGENLVGNPLAGSSLDGRGGNDILWGSEHADTFAGGAQDDVIYSYGGADRFVFDAPGWGQDFVTFFDRAAGSKFDLRGSGVTGFAQLSQVFGTDTRVTAPDGSTIYIYNLAGVVASDFLF